MKLRLRSLQSKETIKIEVPNSCTLQQLKHTLSQSLPNSPSPSSLRFSLNRTDELLAPSPEDDSLLSLGITSGDLVYFSLNTSGFSSGNVQEPLSHQSVSFQKTESFVPNMAENQEPFLKESDISQESMSHSSKEKEAHTIVTDNVVGEDNVEGMDVDDDGALSEDGERLSEPYFLRRVLWKELGSEVNNRKLLVVAVHAVFAESGFVGFDPISGMRVDGFYLPDEWPSMAVSMKLLYTLPELFDNESVTESIFLKFQYVGQFVNVYGSLAEGGSGPYRVCLHENRFSQALVTAWQNCDIDKANPSDGSSRLEIEKDVFEFWKIVKDGLALPLLIELCDKTGLALPACLMRLPAELKLKILESLPGVDVARMGCVCSEMRYLSSSNDLWKQKFTEEFGNGAYGQETINWKLRFAFNWEITRKRKRAVGGRERIPRLFRPYFPIRRDPNPLRFPPSVVGGDYDLSPGGPGLGVPAPFGQPSRTFPRLGRNFSPSCNLGGFNT